MKIKTVYYYTPTRMPQIQNTAANASEDVKQYELSFIAIGRQLEISYEPKHSLTI